MAFGSEDDVKRIPVLSSRADYLRLAALISAIVLISLLHYFTPTSHIWLHPLLERAYYIPILLMGLWFGWRGGIAAAVIVSIFYVPFLVLVWRSNPEYRSTQFVAVGMFFVIGGLIGTFADVERRHRRKIEETAERLRETYAELQSSTDQLRRADRLSALGQLSAGLAHEIRNPLGALKGAVQILEREELPVETRREFAQMAGSEVGRLETLLTNFLDFARPNSPRRTSIEPNQLLESVARLAAETAKMAKVTIRIDAGATGTIAIDADQIRQVLLNLVLNAIQAMPHGGEIVLRSRSTNGSVLLEVVDQGCGIPQADLERIFDPFFTTRADGTGLGLSIAHQIVSRHSGKISVRNNADRGTTFALSLPVESATEHEYQTKDELR